MGGVGGRRKEGRDIDGVIVVEIGVVESGTAGCVGGAKRGGRGFGVFVWLVVTFDIRALWPGERRRSGSEVGSRRRRLGEYGKVNSLCAWSLT